MTIRALLPSDAPPAKISNGGAKSGDHTPLIGCEVETGHGAVGYAFGKRDVVACHAD